MGEKMDNTQEIFEACNNVVIEETSNVISQDNNNVLSYEQTHNVVLPPEEKKIAINVSAIKKVRKECKCAKQNSFTLSEVWLGLASLLLGAFLSALMSDIAYEWSWKSVLFYSMCPVGGVGFSVAYFFCRSNNNRNIVQFAEKIEEYILNPEEVEEQENEY